jgi:hypothetical protein
MKEEILHTSAKEYYFMAEYAHKNNKPNSAVILYFKALVALADIQLLRTTQQTPSSYTKRFRMLQEHLPKTYDIIDKDFPYYQDSYIQILEKELAEVIRDDVHILQKELQLNLS